MYSKFHLGRYIVGYTVGNLVLQLLYKLYVICNANSFHSFTFKICIMIVHTLQMCTSDAGQEQSLVLLLLNSLI